MKPLPIRGRGASENPASRFDTLAVEREEWTHAEDPAPETRLLVDRSRTIVASNDSPDVGFDVSINPYRGCEHGCVWCMDGDTPILMGDGRRKRLRDLAPGDEIYGTERDGWYRRYVRTRVLAHWSVWRPAYRVTLGDGTELVCGADHRFLTLRGWKYVTGTQQGANRRPHLTFNDSLLGTGGFGTAIQTGIHYRTGYLCGMIRGDGLLGTYRYGPRTGGGSVQRQFRLALTDEQGLSRTERFLEREGIAVRRFRFRQGSDKRQTMGALRTHASEPIRRIKELIAWPAESRDDWIRGFLAGIFDAEGSYSGGILRISNTDEEIVRRTVRSLEHLEFDFALEPRRCESGKRITFIRVRGGLREHLRFFHATRPAIRRKCDIEGQALKSSADLRVRSIEPLGRTLPLYDITTGTGDFIADGVVSHNCYARPTHEYLGMSAGLDFESRILVKADAPALLRETLASPKWTPQVIAMSGVTDPYQPAERRLEITRRVLQVLAEFRNPVGVITKNHLVTRDRDVLGELAAHDAATVSLSVTTLDRSLQRVMEPRTSIPSRRLEAIRKLAEAGIPVGVNVAPVIPGLTDHEMPAILEAAAEAGATRAGWIMLRLPHGVKDLFETWLEQHFPDRKDKVLNRLRALRGGTLYDSRWRTRMRGEGAFADQVADLFEVTCRRLGLNRERRKLSTASFRRATGPGGQIPLFGDDG